MEDRIAELENRIAAAESQNSNQAGPSSSQPRGEGFTPSVPGADDRLLLPTQCKHPVALFDDTGLLEQLENWAVETPMPNTLRTHL